VVGGVGGAALEGLARGFRFGGRHGEILGRFLGEGKAAEKAEGRRQKAKGRKQKAENAGRGGGRARD
jgi:hypothetical protein